MNSRRKDRSSALPDRRLRIFGRDESGFTLVELLVAIGMVVFGALILVPALARTKPTNSAIQCMNNLRQLQCAHTMYAGNYNGRLVANNGGVTVDITQWATGWLDWGTSVANTNTQYLANGALGPYTGKSSSIYKCSADKVPSSVGSRVRSYSMNGFVGGTVERDSFGYGSYRVFLKDSEFAAPGAAKTFVFIEEHPDSINDELLGMQMPATGSWPAATLWNDVPASAHNGAVALSFADTHVEIHKWLDANTKRPVVKGSCGAIGTTSPNDSRWLVGRASAPL